MQLPIHGVRERIVDLLRENQVVILEGATGSGKTTQLPVFLYEAGFAETGMIGITEPRKIAAVTVAEYVAGLLGPRHAGRVGHQVRFDQTVTAYTQVKFMTDGILLREIQTDPFLRKYSVIVVDEAHERSANIDFILGLLLDLLSKRSDLKVVVSSATIDTQKFSAYFGGAPIVSVEGTMFPVEVVETEPVGEDLVEIACNRVSIIHAEGAPGDILVFLTGQDEIERATAFMEDLGCPDLVALGCYGTMAPQDQVKIFQTFPGKRKVIFATNIAETSITIDGVVHVVDSGLVKQVSFHAESGIASIDVVEHSQAGCNQRKGRAGRTRAGFYYPLYPMTSFRFRPVFTEPEIRRMSIAGVVLAMERIGIEDVMNFRFVDAPDRIAFVEAYETLIALGAIDTMTRKITKLGERMADLPLEPRLARMVIAADQHSCTRSIATIVAFMSIGNPFVRPKGREMEAELSQGKFKDPRSDFLSYLRVWVEYVRSGFSREWCFKNFLNAKVLQEVKNVRNQLLLILERSGIKVTESGSEESISKCVASGLLFNLFQGGGRYSYHGVVRKDSFGNPLEVFIHPGSALFGGFGSVWIVAFETKRTTKLFARCVMEVNPEWLPELMPAVFSCQARILSVDHGDATATVATALLKNGSVHSEYNQRYVDLAEAEAIQNVAIERARELGWVKLLCCGTFLSTKPFVGSNARTMSSVTPGATYYCAPTKALFGLGNMVQAMFKVFDFEPAPSVPVRSTVPVVAKVVQADRPASAEELAGLAALFKK